MPPDPPGNSAAAPPVPALLERLQRLVDARHEGAVYNALVDLVATTALPERAAFAAVVTEDGSVASLAPAETLRADVPHRAIEIADLCFEYGDACRIDDVEDVRSAAAAADDVGGEGLRSMLVVPVRGEQVLVVGAPDPGAFTDEDLAVVTRLCALAESISGRANRSPDLPEAVYGLLSHDIRSPLHAAQGWVDVVESDGDLEYLADVRRALERIEEYLDSATAIIETGLLIHSTEPVDLGETVDRVTAMVEGVTVEVAESATITANRTSLTQILDNLIGNAAEHGGTDVTVTVGVTEDGFYVEDDGAGIAEDRRGDILQRGTSTKPGERGLGLSIVRRLAEGHGWRFDVAESDAGGARFVFAHVEIVDR